jgi:flagellar hook-length control protein FliK
MPTSISTTTTAAQAQTAGNGAGPADTSGADFLAMLAQFLGAPAPTTPVVPELVAQLAGDMTDATDPAPAPGAEAAALAAIIPIMPVPQMLQVGEESDVNQILSIAGGTSAKTLELSAGARMLDELAQADDSGTQSVDGQSRTDAAQFSLQQAAEKLAQTHTVERDAVLSRSVQTPVGSAAWADEIGARLTVMAEQGRHSASLRLSPEHLGPLEIRISMNDDKASVWFGAAHADTRAAIEHALPRLRELFSSQGLTLADAGVFKEPPKNQSAWNEGRGIDGEPTSQADTTVSSVHLRLGLIDAYA